MEKKRYFICFYSGTNSKRDIISGFVLSITNGSYVNNTSVLRDIKSNDSDDSLRVVLNNIIELNESDFNDFCR